MSQQKSLTPIKAIKDKCKNDCCGGDRDEWINCPVKTCALYPYRLGHNPNRKGIGCKGGNPKLGKKIQS
jgi:hypothetical protein